MDRLKIRVEQELCRNTHSVELQVPLIFRSTSVPPFLLLIPVNVTHAQESRMLPPSSSPVSLHTGVKDALR